MTDPRKWEGNPDIPDFGIELTSVPIKATRRKLRATWAERHGCGKVALHDGRILDLNGCGEWHDGGAIPSGWVFARVPREPPAHLVRFCSEHKGAIPKVLEGKLVERVGPL